jgi:hypothetical protein
MTTSILHIMIINILIALILIAAFLILILGLLTEYLCTKPKSNKFRQWWSNHIVDLDDRYNN